MSKTEIFDYFYTNSANLTGIMILKLFLAGFIIGLIIFATYYFSYIGGVAYNSKFNINLIILLFISEVIMLMISSNIVVSLGMVGALSIVRFRTAIKDTRDTIFIFWAMVEGLCIGTLNFLLAVTSSLIIGVVLIGHSMIIKNGFNKWMFVITVIGKNYEYVNIESVLKSFKLKSKIRSINSYEDKTNYIVEIRLIGKEKIDNVKNALVNQGSILTVNCVSESSDTTL